MELQGRVAAWERWLAGYCAALASEGVAREAQAALQNAANPRVVPRNHALAAIAARVEAGDDMPLHRSAGGRGRVGWGGVLSLTALTICADSQLCAWKFGTRAVQPVPNHRSTAECFKPPGCRAQVHGGPGSALLSRSRCGPCLAAAGPASAAARAGRAVLRLMSLRSLSLNHGNKTPAVQRSPADTPADTAQLTHTPPCPQP